MLYDSIDVHTEAGWVRFTPSLHHLLLHQSLESLTYIPTRMVLTHTLYTNHPVKRVMFGDPGAHRSSHPRRIQIDLPGLNH